MGEVVLIPAGCPHQVRNLYPSIKLAMGFVSPESAASCVKLASGFRALPPHHKRNVDIINPPTLLSQAWNNCLKSLDLAPVFQNDDVIIPVLSGKRGRPADITSAAATPHPVPTKRSRPTSS